MYHPPIITILNDHEFELVEPFVFEWEDEKTGERRRITIPSGYPFDGASVPRICWSLTGLLPTGVHLGAAAIHDYVYQRRGRLIRDELQRYDKVSGRWVPIAEVWTRRQCDDLFLRIMQDAGETPWKARTMHWAVRIFGGIAWDK